MNNQNEENLKELFTKLLGTEQADQAAEDFRKADQILSEQSISPDNSLIAEIKAKVNDSLQRRKTNTFKHFAYKIAAVAAVFAILATVSVQFFEKNVNQPVEVVAASTMPAWIWETDDISGTDPELATLSAEIEQIEEEFSALRFSENDDNSGNGSEDLIELEAELIEIDNTFWKG